MSALGGGISRDPIAERGGLNLYGFVANSAIAVIDPDGRRQFVIYLYLRVDDQSLNFRAELYSAYLRLLQTINRRVVLAWGGLPPGRSRGFQNTHPACPSVFVEAVVTRPGILRMPQGVTGDTYVGGIQIVGWQHDFMGVAYPERMDIPGTLIDSGPRSILTAITLAHETFHALGATHTPDDVASIMYPNLRQSWSTAFPRLAQTTMTEIDRFLERGAR